MRTNGAWLLAIAGICAGCGELSTEADESSVVVSAPLTITSSYWRAGTTSPQRAACGLGDVMIGAGIDGNVPYIKCGIITQPIMDPVGAYTGTATNLGVTPACNTTLDAAVNWQLANFVTTITCEQRRNWHFTADYVDGPGNALWGQEWFWVGSGANAHQVLGHVCRKRGFVVRAADIDPDHDQFVCGG